MQLPRIAIPEINQDINNYVNAVRAAGMEPVVISVQMEQIQQKYQQEYLDYSEFRISSYEGLLLPGGWDINPRLYGQENTGSLEIIDLLDDIQLTMLDDFVKAGKPVLGICRGYQLINIYYGGTLIQDIPTKWTHCHPVTWEDRVHASHGTSGTWLSDLYGTEFVHNSSHHQAIDVCGKDLEIISWSDGDNVPEAFQHKSLPVYGVQWHPERMCLSLSRSDTVSGFPIFEYFCRLCGGKPETFEREHAVRSGTQIMDEGMGL